MGALRLVHSMPPYFYERFAPADTQDRDHRVRQPDRRQERRGHQVGRLRHLRHRRRHPGRRGGEPVVVVGALSNKGMGVISKAGSDIRTHQGPQGQERRHLAGLDAGGLHPGAAAHGGHDRSRTSRRCACRSARCPPCWRAATSTPMSAPSRARPRRSPRARASSSNIPTGTPMGGLNMIFGTHEDTVAKNPDLVRKHAGDSTARPPSS